jgi:hypothetical protein
MPLPEVDLVEVAHNVGRPTRATCGSCHFFSGGAPNAKHGDLEPALAAPSPELDQHMGRRDMRCQDCHTTTRHRIAGMSMTAPAMEGRVLREKTAAPHGVSACWEHLDDHVRHRPRPATSPYARSLRPRCAATSGCRRTGRRLGHACRPTTGDSGLR